MKSQTIFPTVSDGDGDYLKAGDHLLGTGKHFLCASNMSH